MIENSKIKEVFKNLLETYQECESIILCFSFSNEEGYKKSYFGGIRIIKSYIVLSIINVSQKELRNWAQTIEDFNIKNIFIDIEKKLPFEFTIDKDKKRTNIEYSNIYAEATERLSFAEIIPWSSTDLTANATVKLLRKELGNNLSGREVSIIGLGAIGFQLSLSLIREGVKVNCFTKDYTKGLIKANSINTIRSDFTLASFNLYKSLRTAILSSSILLECSSSINSIGIEFLEDFQLHKLIVDVGKQAFKKDFIKNISIYDLSFKRLDISHALSEFIYNYLYCQNIERKSPSKEAFNSSINLVSDGWKGLPGDIVVDDAKNPRFVLGEVSKTFTIDPIYISFKQWIKSK